MIEQSKSIKETLRCCAVVFLSRAVLFAYRPYVVRSGPAYHLLFPLVATEPPLFRFGMGICLRRAVDFSLTGVGVERNDLHPPDGSASCLE
jgi:hypothetical protein